MAQSHERSTDLEVVRYLSDTSLVGIIPDGFCRLDRVLLPDLGEMSEESLITWAKDRPYTLGESAFDIVTFKKGKRGDWVTYDLDKVGVLQSVVENLTLVAGVPYVTRIIDASPSGDVYSVDVCRKANLEDCQTYERWMLSRRESGSFLSRNRWIEQVQFFRGADGDVEGWIPSRRVGSGTNVELDWNASSRPEVGDEWVGMAVDRGRKTTFLPFVESSKWERKRIIWAPYPQWDSAEMPVVHSQRYLGIRMSDQYRESVNSLASLERVFTDLTATEQEVLARLWNVYWRRQGGRRELISNVLEALNSKGRRRIKSQALRT